MPALSDGTVALREWRPADAPALAPLWSETAARSWITKLRRHRCAGTEVALAITREGHDVPVGNVSLSGFSDDGLSATLGYWLVPASGGDEVLTAAARLLCRWGFEELGLERVELLVEPDDAASLPLAARADGGRPYVVTPTELSVSR